MSQQSESNEHQLVNQIERRASIRRPLRGAAVFQPSVQPAENGRRVHLVDMSADGIGFVAGQDLHVGWEGVLTVQPATPPASPLRFDGVVRRTAFHDET